jgi:hypothetical protein
LGRVLSIVPSIGVGLQEANCRHIDFINERPNLGIGGITPAQKRKIAAILEQF